MKKLLTLALCALSVSAFATTPSIEDQMSYPPRPPILEFPNWWSVIAYNPKNGAFGYGEGNMIKPAQNKALKDCDLASTDTNKQHCQIVIEANHDCVALATGDSPGKYAAVRNSRVKRAEAEQEALAACKTNSANCSITFSACEK